MSAADLLAPYQVWRIAKVDQQMVGSDAKICLTFAESPKPYGCNRTNLKRVAGLFGTDAARWIGQQLLVYRSVTTYQGKTMLCVRLCGPQQAPPDPICDQQGKPFTRTTAFPGRRDGPEGPSYR